jgi:hypothetical protein
MRLARRFCDFDRINDEHFAIVAAPAKLKGSAHLPFT